MIMTLRPLASRSSFHLAWSVPYFPESTPPARGDQTVVPSLLEKGGKLAQKMQVVPGIPVGIQLEKAEVDPSSGPTWRRSHFGVERDELGLDDAAGEHRVLALLEQRRDLAIGRRAIECAPPSARAQAQL